MKRIFGIVVVLLAVASILGVTVFASSYANFTMYEGNWYYSPQFNQGSSTNVEAKLTNNDSSDGGTGQVKAHHVVTGSNPVVCSGTEYLSPNGDYVKCSASGSSISGDVNDAGGYYQYDSTGPINSKLEIQ